MTGRGEQETMEQVLSTRGNKEDLWMPLGERMELRTTLIEHNSKNNPVYNTQFECSQYRIDK